MDQSNSVSFGCWVHRRVLGKGAEVLKNMQLSSGCDISFTRDVDERYISPCVLKGTNASIRSAKRLIEKVLTDSGFLTSTDISAENRGPILVEQFKIPDEYLGLVFGRNGAQLKCIKELTGCQVFFDVDGVNRRRLSSGTLRGTETAIKQAWSFIEDIIAIAEADDSAKTADGRREPSTLEERIEIPSAAIGSVIGNSGKNVWNIVLKSACKIDFAKDAQGRATNPFALRGTPSAIDRAKVLIRKIVDETGLQSSSSSLHATNGPVLEERFQVPEESVGLIIGPGGSQLKSLRAISSCRINFEKAANGRYTNPCTLQGTKEAIELAKKTMEQLISNVGSQPLRRRTTGSPLRLSARGTHQQQQQQQQQEKVARTTQMASNAVSKAVPHNSGDYKNVQQSDMENYGKL